MRSGIIGSIVFTIIIATICFFVWLLGSSNPTTPAGYVGYLTQGAIFGKETFYGLQNGPTSPGRTWLLKVINISVTPYTYTEDFNGGSSVLSKDNLKIGFSIHIVWKIRKDRMQGFVENYSTLYKNDDADKITQVAYNNFLREPLRTYARDEIQKHNGLEIKDTITPIGKVIFDRIRELAEDTPFDISSIVVGNIQYPEEVANAVSLKMATTQVLERKITEIKIEEQEKAKRIVQAEGIAKAMEIIQAKLTSQYLQHEAIEAQKMMVGSPNHTTIYIPVGANGVPIVGTFDVGGKPVSNGPK